MKTMEQHFFESVYEKADSPRDLPWFEGVPVTLLNRIMWLQEHHGRALDIGCGAGLYSVAMAKAGYEVTGVDFTPRAVEMAEETAREAGVHATFLQVNVLKWNGKQTYDFILDAGCLHGFSDEDRETYKRNLLQWLKPGGDYLLAHFGKRHALDWRPIGPRRWPPRRVVELFSPELDLLEVHEATRTDIPLPVGPEILFCYYWFHRPLPA